jgi:hypothetical protein
MYLIVVCLVFVSVNSAVITESNQSLTTYNPGTITLSTVSNEYQSLTLLPLMIIIMTLISIGIILCFIKRTNYIKYDLYRHLRDKPIDTEFPHISTC